jgi:hypothetical protein
VKSHISATWTVERSASGVEVVGVVGRGQREARLLPDPQQGLVHPPLLGDPVLHHLEVEAVLSEDLGEEPHRLQGGGVRPGEDVLRDLARETAGETDQALAVLGEDVLVDPRSMIEALEIAHRDQLDQVVVAGVAAGEEGEVVVRLGGARGLPVEPAPGGNVDLAAEDRLHPPVATGVVEVHRPEHVAVVGDGHRLHSEALGLGHELADVTGTIEEAVLGVEVEVDEVPLDAHSHSIVEGGLVLTS